MEGIVRLRYIFHDCFVIETESIIMVFDYWRDPVSEQLESGKDSLPLFLSKVNPDKRMYVFVSHHHKDHYTKEIFSWGRYFGNLHYVISKDTARFARHILKEDSIYSGCRPAAGTVTVLSPGGRYSDAFLEVDAFGSTDIGNSYAVKVEDLTLFHAGDLNAWIWKDESTSDEVDAEMRRFNLILDGISARYPKFDIAMFPVDSRIGTDYFTGAKEFVRKIRVDHFFPMHFGLGTEEEQRRRRVDASAIELYANPQRGEYVCLQSPYSSFQRHFGHRPLTT